ncbi:MAG: hypothetical protein WKF92_09035 [Pyrinomonadaceae bacterium]
MLVKSQKFIGLCFGVWLGLLFAACSANNSSTMTTSQNAAVDNQNSNVPNMVNVRSDVHNQNVPVNSENTKVIVSNIRNSRTLDCGKPNEYSFVVVENPTRKNEDFIPKDLNILIGEEVVAKINLPIPDYEAKNFSLNSVEKTKAGFEIKVDWGGGKYHYEIQFNFRCKQNSFYLYKVKNDNFSTTNSDSGNFLDKKETKVTQFEPNLPIEKFVMLDYLQ